MNIAILGTGSVGQTIGAKLAELGHTVMIGTRSVRETLARTQPDQYGNPPFKDWLAQHPAIRLGSYTEAAAHGEVVFNCTAGTGSLDALHAAGSENLNGKILLDLANPLDFSRGMPPSLSVVNTDSLGEQIQRAFPEIRVVKTLNTVTTALMVNPGLLPEATAVFVSGNDPAARAQVSAWLREWFGWQDVIDLGDMTSARGVEMALPAWLALFGKFGTPMFNFKIVRME